MHLREETRFVWLVVWAAASVSLVAQPTSVGCARDGTIKVAQQHQANETDKRHGGANATTTTTTRAPSSAQQRRPPDGPNNATAKHYKLPSWFNFEAFKSLYGKQYPAGPVEELHKRIYLQTSLRVFEQRAQFRARRLGSLASVNGVSDLTREQLDSLVKGQLAADASEAERADRMPDCCSYDQVYGKIIDLLERATSSHDVELSRALVAELKQKPLLVNQIQGDGRELATSELGVAQTRAQSLGRDEPAAAGAEGPQHELKMLASTNATKSHSPTTTIARAPSAIHSIAAASGPTRQPLDWDGRKRLGGAAGERANSLESALGKFGRPRGAPSGLGGELSRPKSGSEAQSGGVAPQGGWPAGTPPALASHYERDLLRQVTEWVSPHSSFGKMLRQGWGNVSGGPVEVRFRIVEGSPAVGSNSTSATNTTGVGPSRRVRASSETI